MKIKNIIIIIVLAAGVLGIWLAFKYGNHLMPHIFAEQRQGHHDVYYCPMHTHFTSDKPGNCPICGMKLVKKENNSHPVKALRQSTDTQDYVTISVNTQKQQLIGLKTILVKRSEAHKTIRMTGYVSTNHDLFQFQDDYVKAYTKFVTVVRDAHRYEHLRRNWESHRELQMQLHEAEEKLLSLGLSQDQIEKLQKVSWRTPWDQPDLLFLKENFEYWVVAQVFEGDLGYIEAGQNVDVDIPSYRERTKGIIRSIGGTINPETRTAKALIELKDYRGELKGNMLVDVSVMVDLGDVIIVPREAVMDTGTRKIVFVQKNEGTFEPRVIKTGWETDDGFEVKSGLKEGERIVTSGNFLLDSESRIEAGLQEGSI